MKSRALCRRRTSPTMQGTWIASTVRRARSIALTFGLLALNWNILHKEKFIVPLLAMEFPFTQIFVFVATRRRRRRPVALCRVNLMRFESAICEQRYVIEFVDPHANCMFALSSILSGARENARSPTACLEEKFILDTSSR